MWPEIENEVDGYLVELEDLLALLRKSFPGILDHEFKVKVIT